MIGQVTFDHQGRTMHAVLNPDRGWTCAEEPELGSILNDVFPVTGVSPAHGVPGYRQLRDAASWLKGTVTIEPRASQPDNVLY